LIFNVLPGCILFVIRIEVFCREGFLLFRKAGEVGDDCAQSAKGSANLVVLRFEECVQFGPG